MIIKLGENFDIAADNVLTAKEALNDAEITKNFIKMAKKLRRLAPKADDFLYFTAIMLHAAEASLVDQKTGEPILGDDGKPITASFEKFKLKNGKDSVRWNCSKKGVMPYRNHNLDIFPAEELVKAHMKWRGRPLCKDHRSESVDGIRGIIIDTYYDPKFKRVHALVALDRKNYADLARKVETGYATSVSMGTAVGRSVCTECGNIATTEKEYCKCVKARSNYGEINLDLSPIELSLVVNGADPAAKVRSIIASMNNYVQKKQARIDEINAQCCVNPTELQSLADTVNEIQTKLHSLMNIEKTAAADLGELVAALKELKDDPESQEEVKNIKSQIRKLVSEESVPEEKKTWPPVRPGAGGLSASPMSNEGYEARTTTEPIGIEPTQRFASEDIVKELQALRANVDKLAGEIKKAASTRDDELNKRSKMRRLYWLGLA